MEKLSVRLRDEYERIVLPEAEEPITDISQIQTTQRPRSSSSYGGVIVDGLEGCQVKFAKCCNPLPGDNIVGFITKGYGISVHKVDCHNILNEMKNDSERFVKVEWKEIEGDASKDGQFEANMRLNVHDRISMIDDITFELADMKVSILSINTQKLTGGEIIFNISISCKNLAHFNSITSRLKGINGVYSVERGKL